MTLILLTVACIASLIAVLSIFLYIIGVLLNRIAENLDDCLGNVKKISQQVEVIISGIEHVNRTAAVVEGALPLLCGGAERIAAKIAAPVATPINGRTNVPPSGRRRSRL